jgi:hypothetical protein
MRRLKQHLSSLAAGKITDTVEVERLLAAVWDQLTSDESGMHGGKLLGRMEDVTWNPPILSFEIERHGGTVMGSTRAELQHWEVDIQNATCSLVKTGHRQLSPMAKRILIKPLVEEIVNALLCRSEDERIEWTDTDSALVKTSKIFPKGSANQRTLAGRRTRFRDAFKCRLEEVGWECQRGHGVEVCHPSAD